MEKDKSIREKFKSGDWVFGLGEHKGCSQVFIGYRGEIQPFDYLDDFEPKNFRLANDKEIQEAIKSEKIDPPTDVDHNPQTK